MAGPAAERASGRRRNVSGILPERCAAQCLDCVACRYTREPHTITLSEALPGWTILFRALAQSSPAGTERSCEQQARRPDRGYGEPPKPFLSSDPLVGLRNGLRCPCSRGSWPGCWPADRTAPQKDPAANSRRNAKLGANGSTLILFRINFSVKRFICFRQPTGEASCVGRF